MKILLASFFASTLVWSAAAVDQTVKINDVHLCCKNCVVGAEKAVAEVDGAQAKADQESGTVTLSGPDKATLQKAADALVKAGYFGKSEDKSIQLVANTGAKGEKVQTLKIEGVHLCCGKCVKAVDHAVKSVPGVKEQTAAKGVKSFEVTGEFDDKAVFTALQKEGLTGKVTK